MNPELQPVIRQLLAIRDQANTMIRLLSVGMPMLDITHEQCAKSGHPQAAFLIGDWAVYRRDTPLSLPVPADTAKPVLPPQAKAEPVPEPQRVSA